MKVAFDGSVVRPPYAGVQLSVLAEMRAIATGLGDLSGCRFFCHDADFGREVRGRGGKVDPLPNALQRPAARILWQQFVLPRVLRQSGVDVLHALAYTAPRRCPVPYVLNVHDLIALERPELCSVANRLHMRALLPGSARRAAACIVSTRHVAARLQAVLGIPEERIVVLPLGVDVARFSAPAPWPWPLGLPEGRPYVLFVGNLEPKKGVGTLLAGYAACASASRVDLVVAGRAAWKCAGLVRRLRSWQGPGRVRWLGRVPSTELPALMQHAVALVMPSIEEGFGLPVLEAMAAGTPVIHSDHPALVEAAGGAGVAFRTSVAADLAGRFDALLGDAAWRAELVAAGRERAAALPWRRWGEGAVTVLAAAARSGRSTPGAG